jgi:hypothetical protein
VALLTFCHNLTLADEAWPLILLEAFEKAQPVRIIPVIKSFSVKLKVPLWKRTEREALPSKVRGGEGSDTHARGERLELLFSAAAASERANRRRQCVCGITAAAAAPPPRKSAAAAPGFSTRENPPLSAHNYPRVRLHAASGIAALMSYNQFGARGGKFSTAKPKSDVEWAMCDMQRLPRRVLACMTPPAGCAPPKCPGLEDITQNLIGRAAAASSGDGSCSAEELCASCDTGTVQHGQSKERRGVEDVHCSEVTRAWSV